MRVPWAERHCQRGFDDVVEQDFVGHRPLLQVYSRLHNQDISPSTYFVPHHIAGRYILCVLLPL